MKLSIAQVQSIIDYIDAVIDAALDNNASADQGLNSSIAQSKAQEIMVKLLTTDLQLP